MKIWFTKETIGLILIVVSISLMSSSIVFAKAKNESCPTGTVAVGLDEKGDFICMDIDTATCPCWDLNSAIEVMQNYWESTTHPFYAPGGQCEFNDTGGMYVGCKTSTGGGGDCDFGMLLVDKIGGVDMYFCKFTAENVAGTILLHRLIPDHFPLSPWGVSEVGIGQVLPIMPHIAESCRQILMAAANATTCPSDDIPMFPVD